MSATPKQTEVLSSLKGSTPEKEINFPKIVITTLVKKGFASKSDKKGVTYVTATEAGKAVVKAAATAAKEAAKKAATKAKKAAKA